MFDIILLFTGLLSLSILMYEEIKKFKKGEFNPQIFSSKENSMKLSSFILIFTMILSVISIDSEFLQGLFYLISSICILIYQNTLSFMYYKANKNSKGILGLIIFDIILISAALKGLSMIFLQ